MNLNFENINSNKITKETIFNKVTQEEIWYYYVPNFTFSKFIKSPLREEKNPSFSFKKQPSGDIIFKDWGSGQSGDIFEYLKLKYKLSYGECLTTLFNDLIKNNPTPKKPVIYNIETDKEEIDKTKRIIPKHKPFNARELKYWRDRGISMTTLLSYNVKSCDMVLVWSKNKNKYFSINSNYFHPIFSYEFSDDGVKYYKIYRPFNKEYKWLFNGTKNCVEGYGQLNFHGELLIISKALKDVMLLRELGYNAIAFQSETNKLDMELLNKLKKRFNNFICMYDNDEVGIKAMKQIKKDYNIPYVTIPSSNSKDLSEFYLENGRSETLKFLNNEFKQKNKKC